MDYTKLRARYEVLKSEKSSIEEVFVLIEQYILPFRGYFNGSVESNNQVQWRRREIYDGTAVLGAQTLASNLHSNLTNPILQWFNIITKNKELNRLNAVKVWLEDCTTLIYQVLQASNFELQVNETYLDLVGFGTAIILEEAHETPDGKLDNLEFTTIPIEECVFETDHRERLCGLYRRLNWTPGQIIEKFGYDNVPDRIREADANPQHSTVRMGVLFAIYRRREIDLQWAASHRVLPPESRPYAAEYYLMDDGTPLEIGGYYEMPAFAPRWRKASGSNWGFSQGMVCLSDVLTLNKFTELGIKVGEKCLDPPALIKRRGVLGNVDLQAGGATVVDDMANVQYLKYEGRFDVSRTTTADLKLAIEKAFFVDQLQLKESPAMTATEVQVRYQLMQRLLGPSLGRLQNDFLDPLIERTFRILFRYGLIPDPPQELVQSGAEFEIEYIGPMARAQRFDSVASIERWMQNVAQMASIFPQALDVPNVDEVVKELGYAAGVPAKLVQSDAAILLARIQKQKQMEQQQQMEMAQGAGQAIKTMGEGVKALSAAQ